jgi:hypothetical protein
VGVLRGSVVLGAVAVGVLLVGPAAWAEPVPGATSSAPGGGSPGPPTARPEPTTVTPTTTTPTSSPATSSPAPPTATSEPASPTPTASPTASPTAAPTGTAPGAAVTGTAVADCSAEQVVFTVVNGAGEGITAGIAASGAPPFRTFPVPAGEQRVVRLSPGTGPFHYTLQLVHPTRVLATVDGFFSCPSRRDLAVPATSGRPATVSGVCAVAVFLTGGGPAHGRVTVTGDTGLTYTSAAGYAGPDQFDYACLTSEGVFGTVFVQVRAAAAGTVEPTRPAAVVQPTGPPPSAGALASTGSDSAGIAASGAALVLAGALLLGGLGLTRRAQRGGRFWS